MLRIIHIQTQCSALMVNYPKFKVDDHVRISKYKNIFAKGYPTNLSEEVYVIRKSKNTVPWTYVINDLNGDEIIGTFYEKVLQKICLINLPYEIKYK